MSEKLKKTWLYSIVLTFIIVNTLLFTQDFFWMLLLPIILLIGTFYFFALDKLVLLIIFLTPLSINSSDFYGGLGLSMPTEPLLFGILILFFLKIIYEKQYDPQILKHPITICILLYLGWMFISSLTSEDIIVSIKHFTAKLWFIVSAYFILIYVFKKQKNIPLFFWLYIIPLTLVILYTLYNHSLFNFDENPGHWVMTPFYNDHTAYGAALAFFFPALLIFTLTGNKTVKIRLLILSVFLIFVTATLLSYCRAAWVSILATFAFYILILMRVNFRWLAGLLVVVLAIVVIYENDIKESMKKNKQVYSSNIIEHAQTISNISTDASNLERFNRWESAFMMFKEKPIFGWGPGTYQFYYGPFQLSKNKTTISTNAGDQGNAHSEYLGPLAEMGLIGMSLFIAILIYVYSTALKLLKSLTDKRSRYMVLAAILGLTTYYTHGVLNNFLETDKAAIPFWGMIAVIVAIDLYHKDQNTESELAL